MTKKTIIGIGLFVVAFGLGMLAGNLGSFQQAKAQEGEGECTVTQERLQKIYDVAFHRPTDQGADVHVGKSLEQVLTDISSSEEQEKYSAMYKATKALEEKQREPGEVSSSTLETYKDYIDQSASIINEWSKSLPEQAEENAVFGPEKARNALQKAFESMNQTAKDNAEKGFMQAKKSIGPPSELPTPGGQGNMGE